MGSGATPTYAFPYPVKGDGRNSPLDIQALAQAVENELSTRPWWSFVRWTSGTLGTGTDATLTGWDSQEANFSYGVTSPAGGVIVPKAGLYQVTVDLTFLATWGGSPLPLVSVGFRTIGPTVREVYLQRQEGSSGGGGQRRSFCVPGMVRCAVGDSIVGLMNQSGGTGTVTHSPTQTNNDRSSTRFSGFWVAP
jgi:hypothetical protein